MYVQEKSENKEYYIIWLYIINMIYNILINKGLYNKIKIHESWIYDINDIIKK